MITLHDGKNLILKQDRDYLILDRKIRGRLSRRDVARIDRLMTPAEEDTWYGEASKRQEVEALVKDIEERRAGFWTSKSEMERAHQQRIGGR